MKNFFKQIIKLCVLTSIFVTTFFIFSEGNIYAGEMTMHAVFVGKGDAIIIESNNHYMVVDSGLPSTSATILSYLKSLNIPNNKIDYVVSTHPDGDHVGGFATIFENFSIGKVYYSPCTKATSEYYAFINSVKEEGCPYKTPTTNEKWTLGNAQVQVMYDGSLGSTYNECSIVLKVTCDGKSILLTGDLPSTMEKVLMNKKVNLKADILKVGHHGAAASTCADFLDAVNPDYAVISCGKPSETELPKPTVLMKLARRFIKTYRTSDKNVVIHVNNGKITTSNKENNGYQSIKYAKVTLSNNIYYADGKKKKPKPTVYVNGVLVPSSHYKVSYSSNKHAGKARVKITATEVKYVSTCSTYFTIKPESVDVNCILKGPNKAKLTWTSQSSIDGYTISYSTNKKFKNNVKTITCSEKTLKKTISNLSFKTKYYFKIRAFKNNIGNSKWSDVISLKTSTTPKPSKPTITALKPGKKSLKVTWSKTSNTSGYVLQYSTNKKFKNKQFVKITKSKTTKKTLKKLSHKKKYYIRIISYNKYRYGHWSKVKKATIK